MHVKAQRRMLEQLREGTRILVARPTHETDTEIWLRSDEATKEIMAYIEARMQE